VFVNQHIARVLSPKSLLKAIQAYADHDLARLGKHPLATAEAVDKRLREAGYPDDPFGRGKALQQLLDDALARLEDQTDPRCVQIIRGRLKGLSPDALATQLHISPPTLYAVQREKALPALASILWELEQEAARSQRIARLQRHLPPPTYTHLFGVDAIADQLKQFLLADASPWLISLEGPGGAGKTALARHVVAMVSQHDRFHDILWITVMARTFDSIHLGRRAVSRFSLSDLLDSLATQMGISRAHWDSESEMSALVTAAMHERPYLVVVDNLEASADVRNLLPQLHSLAQPSKFLLTSRQRLNDYPGLQSIALHQLSEVDGLAFIRYQAAKLGLTELAQAPEASLWAIWQAAGGNPLAIKLIVRQLIRLPLPTVLDSLKQARGLLEPLYRHLLHTAWSGLSDDGRWLLLAQLLLPPEPATWDDFSLATRLSESELAVAVAELVRLNLLEVAGGVEKHYQLHPLTRNFSEARLRDLETNEPLRLRFQRQLSRLGEHLLAYWQDHAQDYEALNSKAALLLHVMGLCESLATEPSVLVALAQAAHPFMISMGYWSRWERPLRAALAAAANMDDSSARAHLLSNLGTLLSWRGQLDEATACQTEALALSLCANDDSLIAACCTGLGDIHRRKADIEQAEAFYRRAMEHQKRLGEQDKMADAYLALSALAWLQGKWSQSKETTQQALQIGKALNDPHRIATALNSLGLCSYYMGCWEEAIRYLNEALALARQADSPLGQASLLGNLGIILTDIGRWKQGMAYL